MKEKYDNKDYLDLIIQYLYHALSIYNNLQNKYSFRFFVLTMWDAYTILFEGYLEINNKEYINKETGNSYDLISLFGKVGKFFNSNSSDILPSAIQENLKFFKKFRNYYVHKPIDKWVIRPNNSLKKEYMDYSYSFVNNFIYLTKKLFNIDDKLLEINLFLSFDNYNYEYPKNNILIKKMNKYIDNLNNDINSNNFFKNNKNDKSNFYDAELKTKDTGRINNDGKFKSQELLENVLINFPNLKHSKEWTKSNSHVIFYILNINNDFLKKSKDNEEWFNKHCLYIEKYNNYLYKSSLIPYIKFILDNYEKKYINKMYFSKNKKISFSLSEINNWNIENYK